MKGDNPDEVRASETPIVVLIIDNHPLFRATVEHYLKQTSATAVDVVGMTATAAAVAVAMAIRPHVVLVDIGRESERGWELIRRIRSKLAEVRIVVMGWETPADQPQEAASGADAFVRKDQIDASLLQTIRDLTGMPLYWPDTTVLKGAWWRSDAATE